MYFSLKKPVKQANYSPKFFTRLSQGPWLMLVTPNLHSANKINLSANFHLNIDIFILPKLHNYRNLQNKPASNSIA